MIRIYPTLDQPVNCRICGEKIQDYAILWQGVHTVINYNCPDCNNTLFVDLPVNQSFLENYYLVKGSDKIFSVSDDVEVSGNKWLTTRLKAMLNPDEKEIKLTKEVRKVYRKVVLLNTIDFIFGHSLLYILNLQRLIDHIEPDIGIIVMVQPMLKWLVPKTGIAEIWTVELRFNDVNKFYPSLSSGINSELKRFDACFLSAGHVLPTNENINIALFTGITPYNFYIPKQQKRITFIWREDAGRLWIKNIYLLKGVKKSGLGNLLLPFQYFRLYRFVNQFSRKLNNDSYQFTIAGIGKFGTFQPFVDDRRITSFTEENEREQCIVYAESELVIGMHGSGMLLPSAHAGMVVSMMPSKRWGNFAEDILYAENDVRLAAFQRRVVPINLSLNELVDICLNMIKGRDYFVKKFIHSDEL